MTAFIDNTTKKNPENNHKWSIQISLNIRNHIKEHCDKNGLRMYAFVEKAIQNAITGSMINE